jgi:hypothetical protein
MRELSVKLLDPWRYVSRLQQIIAGRPERRMRRAVESHYHHSRPQPLALGAGSILCEGMWDNPNHFFRLHLMLSALAKADEAPVVGVLHNRREARQRESLESLGVGAIVYLDDEPADRGRFLEEARHLLDGVRSHRDLLELQLPQQLPAYIYYDTVLKRARDPHPPLESPLWTTVLAEVLRNLAVYHAVFREHRVACVISSHPWKNEFATLCWTAIRGGVPCYYLTGFCEYTRIRLLETPDDFATPVEHLPLEQFLTLPPTAQARLIEYGRAYLTERERGASSDINTRHAFRPERRQLERSAARRSLGVPDDRPLVAVYSQVWFDFPHTFAMQHFTDFLDWIRFTVAEVAKHTAATWLLKPHPCDAWYGSIRLADFVGGLPPHVRLCEEATDSMTVQLAADAIVTVHGTIGIEAAARGLPVLCADRSHYSDWGFTHVAKSREDYAALLATIHTLPSLTDEQRDRAMAFAALSLAPPPNGVLRTSCDTNGPLLYREILSHLDSPAALRDETKAIEAWLGTSSASYAAYHTAQWSQGR